MKIWDMAAKECVHTFDSAHSNQVTGFLSVYDPPPPVVSGTCVLFFRVRETCCSVTFRPPFFLFSVRS